LYIKITLLFSLNIILDNTIYFFESTYIIETHLAQDVLNAWIYITTKQKQKNSNYCTRKNAAVKQLLNHHKQQQKTPLAAKNAQAQRLFQPPTRPSERRAPTRPTSAVPPKEASSGHFKHRPVQLIWWSYKINSNRKLQREHSNYTI